MHQLLIGDLPQISEQIVLGPLGVEYALVGAYLD
jgi:hypothetical protein